MIIDCGYGAEIKNPKWNENVYSMLISLFGPNLKKTFATCYEEENENETAEEYAKFFCDEYENQMYGWSGITGLVADIINENEFDGNPVFRAYFDGFLDALYVSFDMPEDEAERSTMMTKQQVRKIIAKYLAPLLNSRINFDYIDIQDI